MARTPLDPVNNPAYYEVIDELYTRIHADYPDTVYFKPGIVVDSELKGINARYDFKENVFVVSPDTVDADKLTAEQFSGVIEHEWGHFVKSKLEPPSLVDVALHWAGIDRTPAKAEECEVDYFAAKYVGADTMIGLLEATNTESGNAHPAEAERIAMLKTTQSYTQPITEIAFDAQCEIVDISPTASGSPTQRGK
ncbi:MAG: hypothetical protein CMM93_08915 [Rickettsiales bacterium]|nr:hypothetical protein [Rickettsiales bacterium]|tara:strand:+ start:6877 stop:7461 length:585 start_codon:yes stop_codon:yes gene_type:complete